jgi:hypothetical protein
MNFADQAVLDLALLMRISSKVSLLCRGEKKKAACSGWQCAAMGLRGTCRAALRKCLRPEIHQQPREVPNYNCFLPPVCQKSGT